MFYIFYGKNRQKVSEKAYALAKGLIAKKPDASYVKVDGENWSPEILDELSSTQGLFEHKHVVLCDNLWTDGLAAEAEAETIAASENVFILIETGLSSAKQKKLTSLASGETEVVSAEASKEFNVFTLSDALGEKDKKKLWVLYREAVAAGVDPEEVHNILFWQIKNIILAKEDRLSGKVKVAPFVASKAKRYGANWQKEELQTHMKKMAELYHKSRLGQAEMETSLERLILEI